MKKPRLIYYNDLRHYLMYRFDPPMSLHQFRRPVDEVLCTGVDTLSVGLASGQTFWHDTKVGLKWGERVERHNNGVMWITPLRSLPPPLWRSRRRGGGGCRWGRRQDGVTRAVCGVLRGSDEFNGIPQLGGSTPLPSTDAPDRGPAHALEGVFTGQISSMEQPMVMRRSARSAISAVSSLGLLALRSIPCSSITCATTGWIRSEGMVPAEATSMASPA